jgi:hypothetical protein
MGIFAEVGKEAEVGSSKCKLSPGSFSGDEPPALKFSALLTEGDAERLESARVGFAPKVHSDQKPQT